MKRLILITTITCLCVLFIAQTSNGQTSNQAKIDSLNKVAEEKSKKIIQDAKDKKVAQDKKAADIKAKNDSIIAARKEVAERSKEHQAELLKQTKLRNDSMAEVRKEVARRSKEIQEEKLRQAKLKNDSIATARKKIAEVKAQEAATLKAATDEKNKKIDQAKKDAKKNLEDD